MLRTCPNRTLAIELDVKKTTLTLTLSVIDLVRKGRNTERTCNLSALKDRSYDCKDWFNELFQTARSHDHL